MPESAENSPHAVQCLGCDAGCEVYVAVRDGEPTCLGGNNCPTGESFALAQFRNS